MLLATFPLHLLFPLTASFLFVCGLMLIKRASEMGVAPWTVTFVANLWAALVFSLLLPMGGNDQPASMLYQPLIVGGLYVCGQVFTFLALSHGDVSIATPVFSVKVLFVAFLVTAIAGETLPSSVWAAAAMATVGIMLVQQTGWKSEHNRVLFSISFALLAATSFSFFDVLIQQWAPAWGTGRFLPIMFAMAAILSLGFLPWVTPPHKLSRKALLPLFGGTLCIALQAFCIVFALAQFGDAARVNVVYALRGLWSVLLAFLFARWLQSGESELPPSVMLLRFVGAGLLTCAVVMAILAHA